MPGKTAAIIYTLITVSNSAAVHQESGFKSLRTCEQAKSLALYGMSIEDKEAKIAELKQNAAKLEEQLRSEQAEWDMKHPPRLPANACENDIAEGTVTVSSGCPLVRRVSKGVVRDIMLTDFEEQQLSSYSRATRSIEAAHGVVALCVIEP